MKDLQLWKFILENFRRGKPVIFLCVLESKGSSPGRQGFKMAVTADDMTGSVGGGMMEHKFVELAKEMIRRQLEKAIVRKQIHSKNAFVNQSGMICSGEQTLAVYPIKSADIIVIEKIIAALEKGISIRMDFSLTGFSLLENDTMTSQFLFEKESETDFLFSEKIGYRHHLHIIGGGHVSLALSKLMHDLGFYISVYDDREYLNTMEQNIYAEQKQIVKYESIGELFPAESADFIVIMTLGYRTDGVVLRQLLNKKFSYLGLLGSEAKIEKMLAELRDEGIEESIINSIHAPMGIQIHSQTPEEIAVSIAAEIIKVKNSF